MIARHRIPYDILALFAIAGGGQLALSIALTCQRMKKIINERFIVDEVCLTPEQWHRKKHLLIGKFTRFVVVKHIDLSRIPVSATALTLWVDPGASFIFPPHLKSVKMLTFLTHSDASNIQLPDQLEELSLQTYTLSNSIKLPSTLKVLIMNQQFNLPLKGWIFPPSLQSLEFGHDFNVPISGLPSTLQSLKLGWNFNQTCLLPKHLKILKFGAGFNRAIKDLPLNLEILHFGDDFNQPIHHLELLNLEELVFGREFNQHLPILYGSLKKLVLGANFDRSLDLPPSLVTLQLGKYFNQSLGDLPRGITNLTFGERFNRPLPLLPPGLITLNLGDSFDRALSRLPSTIEYLDFGNSFNRSVEKLPQKAKQIRFGNSFNQCVETLKWPQGLSVLHFGACFNQTVDLLELPLNLHRLTFGRSFKKSLAHLQIPPMCEVYVERRDIHHSTFQKRGFSQKGEWYKPRRFVTLRDFILPTQLLERFDF